MHKPARSNPAVDYRIELNRLPRNFSPILIPAKRSLVEVDEPVVALEFRVFRIIRVIRF
jgi:hypothetical protein